MLLRLIFILIRTWASGESNERQSPVIGSGRVTSTEDFECSSVDDKSTEPERIISFGDPSVDCNNLNNRYNRYLVSSK